MTIIKNILIKIKELTKNMLTLRAQLRLMETRLNNIDSKAQTPNYDISSPILTKTLDTNNIWMGEKGVNSYTNMAKLDVYYDSTDDKWKVRGEGVVDTVEFTYDSGTWKSSGVTPQIIISTYPGKALLKTSVITDDGEEKTVFFSFPIYAEYYPG